MSLIVRKIEKSKWLQYDIKRGDDVSADAITNCLKTKFNTLSVWAVNTEKEIDEAVLAIVAAQDHLEAIDIVPLNQDHLIGKGISCIYIKGDTAVEDLINSHKNLTDLSYNKLGIIADHIVDKFKQDEVVRFTFGRLKSILIEAINTGRLNKDDLSESIRKKL